MWYFIITEKALLKDNHERLSFLAKTTNIVDEADVRAKLGNNVS